MTRSEDIVFLSCCLQNLVKACLNRNHDEVDFAKRTLKDANIAISLRDSLTLNEAVEIFHEIDQYFMNETHLESDLERGFRMLAFQSIKDVLGSETILLSDFYVSLAVNLGENNRLQEAIEFAGRGLLIRVRVLGLLSLKTAESHFQLGNLYIWNDNFDEGARELLAARHIYCKILGEKSMLATDCDMLLGELETKRFFHKKAYAHFTRAFRHRYLSIGGNDALTLIAHERMESARQKLFNRCYLPCELLDRAVELDWHLEDSKSLEHFLYIYLSQMNAESVLMADEIFSLIANAYGLYLTHGKASSMSFSSGQSIVTSLETAITADESEKLQKSTLGELRLWETAELDETIESLLIRAFPQDVPSISSLTNNHRSLPTSPLPGLQSHNIHGGASTHNISPVPPLLRRTLSAKSISAQSVQVQTSTTTATSVILQTTLNNNNNSNKNIILATSDNENLLETNKNVAAEEIKSTIEENDNNIMDNAVNSNQVKGTVIEATKEKSNEQEEILLQEKLSKAKGFADKARIQQQFHQLTDISPVKSTANATHTKKNDLSPRPKNWKPISLNSPLRTMTKKTIVIKNMREEEMNYVRDDHGDLFVVAKCSIPALREQLKSRTVAFALLAWLSQHDLAARIAEGKKKKPTASKGGATTGVSNNRKTLSAEEDSESKSNNDNPKNVLNALFGKREGVGSGPNNNSNKIAANSDDQRLDCAKRLPPSVKLPLPPPLPETWPPLPYDGTISSASFSASKANALSKGANKNVAGSSHHATDKKPKMKQLHLLPLTSLTGTFWEATNEPFFKTEEIFDDLEEEFLIGGLKPKKPAFQVAVGSGASSTALALRNAAGSPLGSKATPIETALDPQRAQNINIMLAKFGKRSLDAIAESVMNFEVSTIGLATITSLQQFIPTADEMAKVRAFVERKWKASLTNNDNKSSNKSNHSDSNDTGAGDTITTHKPPLATSAMAAVAAAAAARVMNNNSNNKGEPKDKDDAKSVSSEPSLPPTSEPSPPSNSSAATTTVTATTGKNPEKSLNDLSSKEVQDLRIGRAEQYIFVFSKVVGLEKRLSALSMVLSITELHAYVVQNTEILLTACGEVKGSGRLRFLLRAFLELNNALLRPPNMQKILQATMVNTASNTASSASADATVSTLDTTEDPNSNYNINNNNQVVVPQLQGFGLMQWSKFAQVKCNSGETAQIYLVQKLLHRIPEALMLGQDMPSIEEAKGVLLARLAANVKKLEETVTLLQELLAGNEKETLTKVAEKNLQTALTETQRLTQDAQSRHQQAMSEFIALVQYFGEQSPPVDAEQFFGELSALCKSLATAVTVAGNKTRRKALVTAVPH